MPAAWSPDEFERALRATASSNYHDKHGFHQRMHAGSLQADEVRAWIRNRFYYQRRLPAKDALIVAKLPTREDRREWLERIIEQDGRGQDLGGIESWMRLAEAAGIDRSELETSETVLPGVRFAVDAYVSFCREHEWWEGVAASLTQLEVPALMKTRIEAFEQHYSWVDGSGLDYFRKRMKLEPRFGEHALALVVRAATSREDQERAVGAVRFKCDVLWALLDAVEQSTPG